MDERGNVKVYSVGDEGDLCELAHHNAADRSEESWCQLSMSPSGERVVSRISLHT